jgi:hypothetical protein
MELTRREWLALTALAPAARSLPRGTAPQGDRSPAIDGRIAAVVAAYGAQGFHRTGTPVDRASSDWLAEQVRQIGLAPAQESFALSRVDPIRCELTAGDRRIDGLPLFDGAFTGAQGIRGRLGAATTDADIALVDTAVNAAAAGALGDARRANRHKAIVAVTRGRRPGLCPSNADAFLRPFGPPVVQVSSAEGAWLGELAARGDVAQLIAQVTRTPATAVNVVTSIPGTAPERPPFVVMTPRSGWYWCASERGGGIACWLEIMRALRAAPLKRTVLFVASSGHELGHLGIDAFIARRPGIAANAIGWLHLGANIGAAVDPRTTLQASDDEFDGALTRGLTAAGLTVDRRATRGALPAGEAEAVHRGGGRYASIIGGNGLFHNPNDRGADAIDPPAIARFSRAFTSVARALADAA